MANRLLAVSRLAATGPIERELERRNLRYRQTAKTDIYLRFLKRRMSVFARTASCVQLG